MVKTNKNSALKVPKANFGLKLGQWVSVPYDDEFILIGCVNLWDLVIPNWQRIEVHCGPRIDAIRYNFNVNIAGCLRVVPWIDDQFGLVDGAGRTTALKRLREGQRGKVIPVAVHCMPCTDMKKAGKLLVDLHRNLKVMSSRSTFKALYVAGMEREVAIYDAMQAIGVTIAWKFRKDYQHKQTVAAGALGMAYDTVSDFSKFTKLLSVYRDADGNYDPAALTADFIGGLTVLLCKSSFSFTQMLHGLKHGWTASDILARHKKTNGSAGYGRREHLAGVLERSIRSTL